MRKDTLEQLRKELKAQLTPVFLRSLVRHVDFLIAIHFWRGKQGGEVLPRGESGESVVQHVIEKMLDGRIHWDKESIDLIGYLKSSIRREVGHLSRLSENTRTLSLEPEHIERLEPVWPSTPEEATEWVRAFKELLRHRNEKQLLDIVECMLKGIGKPQQIAAALDINVETVYGAKRKLKRLLGEFLEQRAGVSAKDG